MGNKRRFATPIDSILEHHSDWSGVNAKLAKGERKKRNCYLVLAGITIIIPFRFNNRKQNLLRESAYIMEIEVNILLWIASLIFGKTPKWMPLLMISKKPNRHNNTK
jgi:hypothetical protein